MMQQSKYFTQLLKLHSISTANLAIRTVITSEAYS
jgi:hypothetical protein